MKENITQGAGGGRALVLGFGRSGAAAARLLATRGLRVTAVDQGDGTADAREADVPGAAGVNLLRNCRTLPDGPFELGVVSPGIDCKSEWVMDAVGKCREVISELELGWRYCRCPVLAVTGTNGKSTLTKLLADMLGEAGLRAEPSGNYGVPLCASAMRSESLDWIVAEVSSFQLELVRDFRPRIGIMLNLQPDHLGRHGTMEHYRALKARLFAKMGPDDAAFVHEAEDIRIRAAAGSGRPAWHRFGESAGCDVRYDASRQEVTGVSCGCVLRVPLGGTRFDNPVTGLAAAAAVGAAACCGLKADAMQRAIAGFVPLAHRMEDAGTAGGVRFIDDSKATNLMAVQAALEMTVEPVRLIAGGQFKEKDANLIKEVLKKRVSSAYLIGESAELFESAWRSDVVCRRCGDLQTAVSAAWQDACPGDIILLSPGCASFDQFRSYADRGAQFKDLAGRFIRMQNKEERT